MAHIGTPVRGPSPDSRFGSAAEILPHVLIPDRFVCVYVDAIEIAIGTTRIDMIAVQDRYTSRAGKHNTSGSVIGKIPEFLAIGEVQTPQVVTHLVIPVEQVHLAVFDNRVHHSLCQQQQSTEPPAPSQARSARSPFSGEVEFLAGPRYCGQSAATLLPAVTITTTAANTTLAFISSSFLVWL